MTAQLTRSSAFGNVQVYGTAADAADVINEASQEDKVIAKLRNSSNSGDVYVGISEIVEVIDV